MRKRGMREIDKYKKCIIIANTVEKIIIAISAASNKKS